MTSKSLGEHFLDFVDKLCSMANTEACEDMLEAFGEDSEVDQSFSGYLVAVSEVEDAEGISEEYHFKSIVEEATNIFKERQKQLELEF